jgi:hypothetical protein
MGRFICNCGFFTYAVFLKPYIASRWIWVATHIFQLNYFGIFHVDTSLDNPYGAAKPVEVDHPKQLELFRQPQTRPTRPVDERSFSPVNKWR